MSYFEYQEKEKNRLLSSLENVLNVLNEDESEFDYMTTKTSNAEYSIHQAKILNSLNSVYCFSIYLEDIEYYVYITIV